MSKLSWAATVRLVHQRANFCCEYCQTCQDTIGQALHVEHIDPNGDDDPDNLCLSCPACNLSKARTTDGVDPETQAVAPLFNPRLQTWADHFAWIDNGVRVKGLTHWTSYGCSIEDESGSRCCCPHYMDTRWSTSADLASIENIKCCIW